MNYYDHHIGDYIKDTAHLSMLEDSAYRRLIDAYYTRETPLPEGRKACQKLARAQSKDERAAVDYVLDEFFRLEEDGWHQSRCDVELGKYFANQPAAEEKKENAKDRQRKARERRKKMFEELSGHGVNMPYNATTEQLHAELSRIKSQAVTPPVTRDDTCTQSPVPNPQYPVNLKAAALDQLAPVEQPGNAAALADPIIGRAIELTAMLIKRGAALQASDPRVREWAECGVTDTQALQALDIANSRRQEKADPRPINAGLLDAIIGDLTKAPPQARGSPFMSHADKSKLAAARAIFGTEIEGNQNEQGSRIIDVTPTFAPLLGG